MSQTPTPEALAAADDFIDNWEAGPTMTRHKLALAFEAHTKDLQNTIIRLTRELAEARSANPPVINLL